MKLFGLAILAGGLIYVLRWIWQDDPIWHVSRIAFLDGEWVQEARRP